MNTKIIKDKLPEGATIHHNETFDAITIPADGFEKLIAYHTPEIGTWVHKDYRKKTKKRTKKSKKKT
jgi:hypothetical protein